MNYEKKGIVIFVSICVIVAIITGTVFYFIGQNSKSVRGIREQLEDARRINLELRNEQYRTADNNQRNIESLERIRGITEETNHVIGELRSINRGSQSILTEIRKEIDILEMGLRNIGYEFSNNTDYSISE